MSRILGDKIRTNKLVTDKVEDLNGNVLVETGGGGSFVPLTQKGAASGVATLDSGGLIPVAQIPPRSLPDMTVVADAAARIALTVQEGDEAKQLDDGSHWIYDGTAWHQYPSAGDPFIVNNIQVDSISDMAGTGAPDFPNGLDADYLKQTNITNNIPILRTHASDVWGIFTISNDVGRVPGGGWGWKFMQGATKEVAAITDGGFNRKYLTIGATTSDGAGVFYGHAGDDASEPSALALEDGNSVLSRWLYVRASGDLAMHSAYPTNVSADGDRIVHEGLAEVTFSGDLNVDEIYDSAGTGRPLFGAGLETKDIRGDGINGLIIQGTSGQASTWFASDGAAAEIQVPATAGEVSFSRGITCTSNTSGSTSAGKFDANNRSRALQVSAGNSSGGQADNLAQFQVNGRTLGGNFGGDVLTIYKSGNDMNSFSWSKALMRVWDNDTYDANVTGPLARLQWTNDHVNGRAMLDFTIPSDQDNQAFFWKVGSDLGSTLTFQADTAGNITTDGNIQALDIVATGELTIKVYDQAAEPTLDVDNKLALWKDSDDSDRTYLVFRRGAGDQIKVELA
jgi:hypothetical protein